MQAIKEWEMDDNHSNSIENDDIAHILDMMDEGEFDELELRTGKMELIVKKGKSGNFEHAPQNFRPEPSETRHDYKREADDKDPSSVSKPLNGEHIIDKTVPGEEEGLIPIKAPILGTFYAAKSPGAPPFVEVGQSVAENDIVCIIEVMKLMNSVTAGVRGRIAKILVENGELVEYQQALILVEPEDKNE
jgi:acetyl-CoA carboxylase biotin carboxyl carrier protein